MENQTTILQCIKEFEKTQNVSVLYACDSGSRAHGYHTEASDFDIKLVYIQPAAQYFTLGNKMPKESIRQQMREDVDFSGFDLKHFLRLVQSGNPNVLDFVNSNRVYFQNPKFIPVRQAAQTFCNPIAQHFQFTGEVKQFNEKLAHATSVRPKEILQIAFPAMRLAYLMRHPAYSKHTQEKELLFQGTLSDLTKEIQENQDTYGNLFPAKTCQQVDWALEARRNGYSLVAKEDFCQVINALLDHAKTKFDTTLYVRETPDAKRLETLFRNAVLDKLQEEKILSKNTDKTPVLTIRKINQYSNATSLER